MGNVEDFLIISQLSQFLTIITITATPMLNTSFAAVLQDFSGCSCALPMSAFCLVSKLQVCAPRAGKNVIFEEHEHNSTSMMHLPGDKLLFGQLLEFLGIFNQINLYIICQGQEGLVKILGRRYSLVAHIKVLLKDA